MTADEYYEDRMRYEYSRFGNCTSLLAFGVSDKCPRYTAEDGMLFYKYNGEKLLLVCPQGRTESVILGKDVTGIGPCAFRDCKDLTSVTIPDGIAAFENNIFDGCENIRVTYKGKTYDHSHIGELFDIAMYSGTGMEGGMIIENNTLVKVSENAVTIDIPDTVTEISDDAFYDCSKLETIRFKNKLYTQSDTKDLLAAVHGEEGLTIKNGKLTVVASYLTEVKIPDRVTEIESDTYGAHKTAFKDCGNLRKVTFGKGITELKGMSFAMGGRASIFGWDSCENISEIVISEGVTSLDYNAFYGLEKLKKVNLPSSLETLGPNAFGDCTSLTNITIPDSVTEISVHKEADDPVVGHLIASHGSFDGCINIKATYKGKTYDYAHIEDLYKAINEN